METCGILQKVLISFFLAYVIQNAIFQVPLNVTVAEKGLKQKVVV